MPGLFSLITNYHQVMGAEWQPRQALESVRNKRLSTVVRLAYQAPYYKALFHQAELSPSDIATAADLNKFPVSTKADLKGNGLAVRLTENVDPRRLKSETSSGSTGTPFSVYFSHGYYQIRSLVFLRALRAVGYRLGQRLLLITQTGPGKQAKRWLNWRYASIEEPPEVLAETCKQFRPHFLYGCTTVLRLLAEHWGDATISHWTPNAVITTAEGIDTSTRHLLETTFKARVYDFYGLSEMGLIAWECPEGKGYHLAEDLVIAEFLPIDGKRQAARLVLTNLAQLVMPFIRYDTGDLCVPTDGYCPCGRTFSLVSRFEGREIDCVILGDGTKISPYRLTCEFEKLENVNRFQICQEDYRQFSVLLETSSHSKPSLVQSVINCLNEILGMKVDVTVHVVPKITQQLGRKFRVVESKLGRINSGT